MCPGGGLETGRPYVTHDLPAGGRRLMQKIKGYEVTIVSCALTYRNKGYATGALVGRMTKGQRLLGGAAAE